MPRKIRELKAALRQAGFAWRPGKGSHQLWRHPALPKTAVNLAGNDGDDAKPYQERQVRDALADLGKTGESRQ